MVTQLTSTTPPTVFAFRSGRACLDFAATLMFRSTTEPLELLNDPGALGRWAYEAGIIDDEARCDAPVLEGAIALREAVYRSARGLIDGNGLSVTDRATINGAAELVPPLTTLGPDGDIRRRGDGAAVLAFIARDAVHLFGGDDRGRLHQCARDGCTRFFVDRSRGGNRSWCGMRECGNRVNAAAYRRRREK